MSDGAPVAVGINGFGTVGREVFFACLADPHVIVTAINDPAVSAEYVAYVIEHEASEYTRASVAVELGAADVIIVNGAKIAVTHAHDFRSIGWGERHARTVVVECSGASTTRERCWPHISGGGAVGVVIAAQSADAPVVAPPFLNEGELAERLPVVCGGAGVGSVLVPVVHVLQSTLGIEELSFTAVQGTQPVDPACGRSSDRREWRQARLTSSGSGAIVPYDHSGVATLLRVFPQLRGKVAGSALQVPVRRGCAVDMVVRTSTPATKEQLDDLLRRGAMEEEAFGALIEVGDADDLYISSDCLHHAKVLYDARASQTLPCGRTHKLLLWVDAERAYAHRLLMVVKAASAAMGKAHSS